MQKPKIIGALVFCGLCASTPVLAQSEYGGGWAVPSLETASSITNDVMMSEMILRNGSIGSQKAEKVPSVNTTRTKRGTSASETKFTRSASLTRKTQQDILRGVAARQPEAAPQLEKVFRTQNMASTFDTITRPYGLHSDDVADALTAYWVMGWVIANKAELPSAGVVRAARAQVVRGFGQSGVTPLDAAQRQRLADHSIFSFLVLNSAWRDGNKQGVASPAYGQLSDGVQRSFSPMGANLRGLVLGPQGFAKR